MHFATRFAACAAVMKAAACAAAGKVAACARTVKLAACAKIVKFAACAGIVKFAAYAGNVKLVTYAAVAFALVLARAEAAEPPAIFFTDVEAGPTAGGPGGHGVPIAIFGKGFGATRGASRVTINGTEAAAYLVWGQNNANNRALDMIVVQPAAGTTAGPIVVTVGGLASNADQRFTPSGGKIYYVAPAGSDAAPCSLAQPCATILHTATNIMQAGDALLVRGGNLNDDEIWIRQEYNHGGQPGKPKIIRNYPGEAPTFARVNRPVIVDANYVTFSGFHFINGKAIGVGREGLRGQRVYNSTFRGTISWDAIGTHGDDIVLAGNDCDVTSSSVGTQGHCYYISHGNNIKLLYNVGRGAPGYGIHIFDQRRSANDIVRVISNVLVEGNLLAASPERSGLIVAMGDEDGKGNRVDGVTIRNNIFTANNFAGVALGGNVRNVKIYHNTFYQNGRQGVTLYDEPSLSGVEISNNLIDQSANANCRANCSWYALAHVQKGARAASVVVSNNFYALAPPIVLGAVDSAPASGVPSFVGAAAGNYRLGAGSAAIDKGRALAGVTRDFDGRPRAQGRAPDAGAFESGAVTTPPPPPPGGATLSISTTSIAPGASINASWSAIPTPVATDWIGLHRPGQSSQTILNWMYVSCTRTAGGARAAGSCSFPIPAGLASGSYELRLHSANGYIVIATSAALTVSGGVSPPPSTGLTVSSGTVARGARVTVNWGGVSSATPTHWIGLYQRGADARAFLEWIYMSCSKTAGAARADGSCPFVIPGTLAPGSYEFRMNAANGFTQVLNSAPVTVQ